MRLLVVSLYTLLPACANHPYTWFLWGFFGTAIPTPGCCVFGMAISTSLYIKCVIKKIRKKRFVLVDIEEKDDAQILRGVLCHRC